jgi:hypothetical protein
MTRRQIERRIEQIKKHLAQVGPMHPGSLGKQYNVCGTPGCRCKDSRRPRKHGPYYQLSYVWGGKSSSRFVRSERMAATRRKVRNYKRFREWVNEWVGLAVELERAERARTKLTDGD